MSVIDINDQNIEETVKSNKKVLVDCYADWCGPCKMLSPIIDEISNNNDETVFCKLNVDDNDDTSSKYNIMSIPTLLYFENGELKSTEVGLKTREELEDMIK